MPTTNRTTPPTYTPWGQTQTCHALGDGIFTVTTAGHGGIWLSPERMKALPEVCRSTPYSKGGWFEEDCDSLIPMFFFYTDLQLTVPRETIAGYIRGMAQYFGSARLVALGVEVVS